MRDALGANTVTVLGGYLAMELKIQGLTKVYKGGVRALDNV